MKWRSAALALLALIGISIAQAQQAYPTGTAKMVVGFAPGGGNDVLARIIAERLKAELGTNFIVENRPGASGVIAIDAVKRAAPDGMTMLVGPSSGMIVNPLVLKNLHYDPVKDFEPVAMVGMFPLIVCVNAKSALKTLQELVALARSKPETINYSSAASSFQVATEAFAQRSGIKIQHVAYRGSAPAATALLTRDVTVNFGDISAVLPLIRGGQLRALAVTTAKRLPSLLDVPTIAESGYPGFSIEFWSGLFLPAGTPETLRSTLQNEIQKIVAMPDVIARMKKLRIEPAFMPGPGLAAKMKSDIETYRKVAAAAGITPK